jgi:hypothetical protein
MFGDLTGFPKPKTLVAADDDLTPKPAPSRYPRAAALFGYPPLECLVIEASAGILLHFQRHASRRRCGALRGAYWAMPLSILHCYRQFAYA